MAIFHILKFTLTSMPRSEVRGAKGEGSEKNIERLGGGWIIEDRVMKMGRLLKERDRQTDRTQSSREEHFPVSFPLLCVNYEACPSLCILHTLSLPAIKPTAVSTQSN